jgi:hypothetical protein
MVETDTAETRRCLFLQARRSNQQNWLFPIEHGSCPTCELPVQTNVDAAREVPCRKLGRSPHVQNLGGSHSGQQLCEVGFITLSASVQVACSFVLKLRHK